MIRKVASTGKPMIISTGMASIAELDETVQTARENVRSIRPGHGLTPKYLDVVLGKKVTRDVKKGTPVSWEMIG